MFLIHPPFSVPIFTTTTRLSLIDPNRKRLGIVMAI